MDQQVITGIIESLLFVTEEPITLEHLRLVLEGVDKGDILECINALKSSYKEQKRGIQIVEIAGGFQLATSPEYLTFITKFHKRKKIERLGQAAMETLAIIAYKQPVSRNDVEFIRGVNVDGVMRNLLDKGLIKSLGRKKNVPGRPFVYGTTKSFLERFGLNSLSNLPDISKFGISESEAEIEETNDDKIIDPILNDNPDDKNSEAIAEEINIEAHSEQNEVEVKE